MYIKPRTVRLAAALTLIAACAEDPAEGLDPGAPDASTSSEGARASDGGARSDGGGRADGGSRAGDGGTRASDGSARTTDGSVNASDGSANASDASTSTSDASTNASDSSTSTSDGGANTSDAGAAGDGGTQSACELPEDCKDVKTPQFEVEACCSREVKCGFRPPTGAVEELADTVTNVVDPEREFKDGCVPRERHFLTFPGLMDERIATEDGKEILIAEECEQSAFLSVAFAGCCMEDGRCGISTYQIYDTLAVVVGSDAKLAQLQCVPSDTMNAHIAETSLAGFAFLPERTGRCDYAALDERLPPVESPLAVP
jgi:hypothetical protein